MSQYDVFNKKYGDIIFIGSDYLWGIIVLSLISLIQNIKTQNKKIYNDNIFIYYNNFGNNKLSFKTIKHSQTIDKAKK